MRTLLLPLLLVAAWPRPADACSPYRCLPGRFVPGDGAIVPANAPGFYFRPAIVDGAPADASLVRLTTAAGTAVPFTAVPQPGGDFVIVPDAPLDAGESYTLADGNLCEGVAPRSTFTAADAAPLPASLGMLRLVGHGVFSEIEVESNNGSCSTTVDATIAGIMLDPSASAAPWADLLLYETLVDDKAWAPRVAFNLRNAPGESWVGRGTDLLYRLCELAPEAPFRGLAPGGHQVRFRASLPGVTGTTSLATPAEAIELMCDPPSPMPPDTVEDDGGCAAARPGSLGFALLALLGLVYRRRR